jgi:hypothetical protein
MSVLYTVLLCVGVGFVFAIGQRTRTWLRLRHIPGPFTAGISEFWLIRHTQGGRIHMDTAEACETYGAIKTPKIQIAVYSVDNCDRTIGASWSQ